MEHDPGLPVTGVRPEFSREDWEAELAEVAGLALPGEDVPGVPPAMISNMRAAVAAHAEAVSDAVQDELGRLAFRAIWADDRHVSSAFEVRRLVSAIMAPPVPILPHLLSPDLPLPILSDPDPAVIVRRSGGTIGPDGGPLTTVGYRLIRRWRQEWQAISGRWFPSSSVPTEAFNPGPRGWNTWLEG